MKTTKIHLADQSFQSKHSENCDLLVRLSPNRVSYAVVDQGNNQLKVLFDSFDGREDLISLTKDDPFLGYRYAKTKISSEGRSFTFIPDEIYSDSDLESYAHFILSNDHSEVLVKQLQPAGTRIIYTVEKPLAEISKTVFSNPVIYNQASPLIESSFRLYGSSSKNILVIQLNRGSFEALLLKNNKLVYYNIFTIENADELNYFLLSLIKQLSLNYQNTEIVLCGDIAAGDEAHARVRKYFNVIIFANISKLVKGIAAFRDVPVHQFFSLIGLNICG